VDQRERNLGGIFLRVKNMAKLENTFIWTMAVLQLALLIFGFITIVRGVAYVSEHGLEGIAKRVWEGQKSVQDSPGQHEN
jgi:hypothetical protein